MLTYDVVVIGGGTAGSNAARASAREGAKTLMIRGLDLLNTCVEEGCMPSKSFLASTRKGMKWEEALKIKDEHIVRLYKALEGGLENEKFDIIKGEARFKTPGELLVKAEDGKSKVVQAKRFVIATGSTPFVPNIEGAKDLTPSTELLVSDDLVGKNSRLKNPPKRVLIVGGGPIGLECATILHQAGSKVMVVEMADRLLPAFDPEFGEERLRFADDTEGFDIILSATLRSLRKESDGIVCHFECRDCAGETTVDAVLIATGRKANLDGLDLEKAGLLVERGRPVHDEKTLETSIPNIFVAGDVVGHNQIVHYAAEMGIVAGARAANPSSEKEMDWDKLSMGVSFDAASSAVIGMTEGEAHTRGYQTVSSIAHFNSIGKGILTQQKHGMWKLTSERGSGKILGSQIIGPEIAGELIQILSPILYYEGTVSDVMKMTWYHPTFGEILKSLAKDICGQFSSLCPGM